LKTTCHFLILLATCIAPQVHAQEENALSPPDQQTTDSFFGMKKVWEIHIQFEADQYKAIQPPDDVNWDAGTAFEGVFKDATSGGNFHSEKSSRPGLAGYMGVDHQYGKATVTIGDDTIEEVGVRYKGNGTFLEGHSSGKFSYKIDFNEYRDEQEYRGLTKVNLNSCVSDPSMLREALSLEFFKAAGIPRPRTAWAKVYLTVTGQKEREYRGLYEIIEQVDKRFLKSRFGSADGLLIKPSTFGAFRYLGEDWEEYKQGYYPKTDGTEQQQQRMIEFARLVHRSDETEFAEQIEEYLDVDQFLNYLAVNVILSNLDSFLGGSQNYYAYLDPESNKILMLPWDLDHSFGTLPLVGKPDSRRNLSIYHPQVGNDHPLVERILAIPQYKEAYLLRIQQLMDGPFGQEKMRQQIEEAGKFLRPLVELDDERALRRFDVALGEKPRLGQPHVLKYFVDQRRESIEKQLSGESQGDKLDWDFGMPRELLVVAGAVLFAMALNAGAWLWGVIAGFRGGATWGFLNMFFYPIAPIAYGFFARKDI
jgi:spore coat protein H